MEMIIPVILAGGAGTRLWPISRELSPKPLMTLADGESLLYKTFARACALPNVGEIITVTNKDYHLQCAREYAMYAQIHLETPLQSYLLEPYKRNTAAAVLMAALRARVIGGEQAVMLVLPADHLIMDLHSFHFACDSAFALAEESKVVTFGIPPTRPETGFGYIEYERAEMIPNAHAVKRFVEKPAHDVAEMYLHAGNFLWNAGMFCFTVNTIIAEYQLHQPELYDQILACWETTNKRAKQSSVIHLDKEKFNAVEDISIDYAIMEKSKQIAVVIGQFDWHDIGSWSAYKDVHSSDDNGNTIIGDAILIDTENTFIHSNDKLVAAIGIQDVMIVNTDDVLLITTPDRCQEVKQIVEKLKILNHESYQSHKVVQRPWGSFTILYETVYCKIKQMHVNPGAVLSLQSHQYRSEHWIVLSGIATVINGDEEYTLKPDQSTYIPTQSIHRIINPTDNELIIIEVQMGSYFGEDDIIRYEDVYGRASTVD